MKRRGHVPDADRSRLHRGHLGPVAAGAAGHRGGGGAQGRAHPRSPQRPGALDPGRRPASDRRGRHGLRLLDALDGARPARPTGTIVTIDPDTERTDLARGWWRQAGIPDERITVVSRPALAAFADREPALDGPFDLAFIDALKDEYVDYLAALRPRLAPGRAGRGRQRALGRDDGAAGRRRRAAWRHRRRCATSTPPCWPIRPSPPPSCPSATGCSWRCCAEHAAGHGDRPR